MGSLDDVSDTEIAAEAGQIRLFETVLSHIADFAYTFDRDGRFTYANKALLDLWGLTLQQAVGKNFFDLKYPDPLAAKLQRQIQQVIDTGVTLSDETPYTSPTGAGGYYEYIFSPVLAPDGSVEAVAGSTRDITARKRVERELLEARRRLDSALIAGEVGTFEWDVAADRLWGDQNFARIFNLELDASGAAPLSNYVAAIHPEDQTRVMSLVRRTVETGCDYEAEYRIVSGERERWVIARGKLERDAGGRASRFAGVVLDITGQKQAVRERQALSDEFRRQSRVYDTILSATDDFAYIFDRAGRFLFANRRLLEVWGRTLDEIIGRTCHELGYPTWHADMHMREIRQVIETKRPIRGEVPFTGGSGISGVYDYIFTPVLGPDGEVEVIAGTTRDVTDRKRAEGERERLLRTLENERSTLAAIIEQAPGFICSLRGPDLVFELANERYYEIVGKREIIGESVRAALPELEGQGFFELLDNVYRTGKSFSGTQMPVLLRRTAGDALEQRFMNLVYQPLREADGSVSGVFVHGVDVTDLVRTTALAQRNAGELEALIESMPHAVYFGNEHGITRCNRLALRMLGASSPADLRARFGELGAKFRVSYRDHPDRMVEPENLPFARALRGEAAALDIWVTKLDGGGRVCVRGTSAPVFEGDRIAGAVAVNTDITEHVRAEDAVREARDAAEAANRAKDRFLAVLSHELRTPLSPVVMTIPAMELDPEMPFKFCEDLAMVRRNIDLEVKLIDDLLDLSRVTSGKLRLQMQPLRVHELLAHVVRSSAAETAGKALRVRHELRAANDLSPADPARLQQVFWNLLRNAVKFTPEGGDICVRTWNRDGDGRLIVQVKDSGVGIPPEVLPRVFDAFEQGEVRMTRQFGGLGLGLAIAKAVVEMHGGAIRAASDGPGRGATFTVELPAARGHAATESPPAAAPAAGKRPARSRVLLVEDHPDTSRAMAALLTRSGYQVKAAHSMASALQFAATEPFDILVSDIGLPDATGYELMEQIRDRFGIKGIALSGYGMEEDMRKSREAGFVEHVIKPVNVAHLQSVIERVLADRRPGRV